MAPLSKIASEKHATLNSLIDQYNELLDKKDQQSELTKIFLLQKINHHFIKTPPDVDLMNWHHETSDTGFERHLQRYGVNRDGSALVKSIQFSKAVSALTENLSTTPTMDYYEALQDRDALFNGNDEPDIAAYTQYNQVIQHQFNEDTSLQDRYARSKHFLALCYAKTEAIQGVVKQSFDEYSTETLGGSFNNKNFILKVGEEQLVIRVEDRQGLDHEQELQTHPVSEYFSEDYMTMMVPVDFGGAVKYSPVVLTEWVGAGSINDYAKSLIGRTKDEIIKKTIHLFTQLSDFCIELMSAGYYHPDLKPGNVLVDERGWMVAADRKAIIDKQNPNGLEATSTPLYAPPEYFQCLEARGGINHMKASRTTFNMPQFMSYEFGMTLKESFLISHGVTVKKEGEEEFRDWNAKEDADEFRDWSAIESMVPNQTPSEQNLIALIQALTMEKPADRLSIEHAQILLNKVDECPHEAFMSELEDHVPGIIELKAQRSSPRRTEPSSPTTSKEDFSEDASTHSIGPDGSGTLILIESESLGSASVIRTVNPEEDALLFSSLIQTSANDTTNTSESEKSSLTTKLTVTEDSVKKTSDNAVNRNLKGALAALKQDEKNAAKDKNYPSIHDVTDIEQAISRGNKIIPK